MIRYMVRTLIPKIVQQNNSEVIPRQLLFNLKTLQNRRELSTINNSTSDNVTPNIKDKNPFNANDYIGTFQQKKDESVKTIKEFVINDLKYRYLMSDEEIKKSCYDHTKTPDWEELKLIIEVLQENGVLKEIFLKNLWILKNSSHLLKTKFDTVKGLKIRDINDFVPFCRLSLSRLQNLVNFLQTDALNIPEVENRFYYICDKLNLEPPVVSQYLSKRLFILNMPLDMLKDNLQYMIDYGVAPMSIVKDLWAFRYTPKSVQLRLERAKDAKKDKIMPWMVRCPERILLRSLKLSIDEMKILGSTSVEEYVSKRLGFDIETTRAIMTKHPAVLRVRATKIKEVLDYLLDEANFTSHEIAQVPRILCHSLETTKQRILHLQSLGCRPSSLIIVCRSRREYEKFVQMWIEMQEKIKSRQNLNVNVGSSK